MPLPKRPAPKDEQKSPDKKITKDIFCVHCTRCGHGRIIASGFIASAITPQVLVKSLRAIGWKSVPKILCRSCASPLDLSEKLYWSKIHDYAEAQDFIRLMRAKYGTDVNLFFSTTSDSSGFSNGFVINET